MSHLQLLLLGIAILWGMLYYGRTGWSCGGIITPGLLALNAASPHALLFSFASSIIVAFLLEIMVRLFPIYGRQRIATAMVIAILLRIVTLEFFPEASLWIGWVIPALIAADIQKQGFFRTLSGAVSVTVVSLMTMEVIRFAMLCL